MNATSMLGSMFCIIIVIIGGIFGRGDLTTFIFSCVFIALFLYIFIVSVFEEVGWSKPSSSTGGEGK